jgi:hypothetical protein
LVKKLFNEDDEMTKRKSFIGFVSLLLVLVIAFYFTGTKFQSNEQKQEW